MKSISNVHPAVNVAFSHWRRLLLCAVAGVALLAPPIAGAAYPEKTVRLIVATAPGTPVDIVTRIVANRMARDLGQAIVVDNKPGAGGIIGA